MSAKVSTGWRKWTLVFVSMVASMAATSAVQEISVPMSLQVSLLTRIWTFDRSQEARLADEFVIAVLYQSQVRSSLLAKEGFVDAALSIASEEHAVRIVEIDYRDPSILSEVLLREDVDIVYVAPLRAVDVHSIATVTRELQVLTCTGVAAYVHEGLSVGLELRDGRPGIIVNREASQQEGATFTSELLKLARLVQGAP